MYSFVSLSFSGVQYHRFAVSNLPLAIYSPLARCASMIIMYDGKYRVRRSRAGVRERKRIAGMRKRRGRGCCSRDTNDFERVTKGLRRIHSVRAPPNGGGLDPRRVRRVARQHDADPMYPDVTSRCSPLIYIPISTLKDGEGDGGGGGGGDGDGNGNGNGNDGDGDDSCTSERARRHRKGRQGAQWASAPG